MYQSQSERIHFPAGDRLGHGNAQRHERCGYRQCHHQRLLGHHQEHRHRYHLRHHAGQLPRRRQRHQPDGLRRGPAGRPETCRSGHGHYRLSRLHPRLFGCGLRHPDPAGQGHPQKDQDPPRNPRGQPFGRSVVHPRFCAAHARPAGGCGSAGHRHRPCHPVRRVWCHLHDAGRLDLCRAVLPEQARKLLYLPG